MSKAQIICTDISMLRGTKEEKGLVTPTRNYQNTRNWLEYVFDLEQRLAAAEAKIPRWIPVHVYDIELLSMGNTR